MASTNTFVDDLIAEGESLDALVADLDNDQWHRATPAAGWTIAHQIGHLAWTDEVATAAVADGAQWQSILAQAAADPTGAVDAGAQQWADLDQAELLTRWRAGRAELARRLGEVPDGVKIPWFGPPMSAASMATARLMETWAHGLDVADALGVTIEPTDRIRNVAHIGVRTRDYAYLVNGKTAPATPFGYQLSAPSGQIWTWGPADADQRVIGSALDFCLLVTQRRHPEDLDLEFVGDDAAEWSQIAQCFAGPPGSGRQPSAPDTMGVTR
ncbi:TIGR03084 family metal-binding protein [Gordonia jinhuaensis]|uniref:TIGR03084 family protein n=1 Tax=Gordonia jinhuaensis TaxID=1517702 RepID=A0A916X092_9ACTN|nr:TIGR03084 family metal-binding protein [Gordonia jinhuaensis]GGB46776.1 hypothetical protein GCM10011489_37560 [Gordonia jinhuaensis]